jgi:ribose transport system permease protein
VTQREPNPSDIRVDGPRVRAGSFQRLQQLSIVALTIVLWAVSISQSNNVPLWAANLLTDAAGVGIIACAMTFVIIAGGFDLSVGSTAAVCGVVAVLLTQMLAGSAPTVAIPLAILGTLATGAILGAVNGALIAYVGVNPFVVTLSTMFVFRGIGLVLTHGGQSQVVPRGLGETFRLMYWGGFEVLRLKISVPMLAFVGVLLICLYLLKLTRFGHYVYATGGNSRAAWLAGINTRFITAATYVLTGLACGVSATLWTGLSNTAQASDYAGKEMIVIASVIVGGTPLTGGRGGLFSTVSGLLLLCTIDQSLTQFRVDPQYRQIVTGLLIVTVVAVDSYFRKRHN